MSRSTVRPLWRRASRTAGATLAVTALLGGVAAAAASGRLVGPRDDGTAVISTAGYTVTPAGQQTQLGDLPFASALSPDGRTLLVSNDGQGEQSLQVIDVATGVVVQNLPYAAPEALYQGLAFSPDGRTAYASAGGNNKVRVYQVADQLLTEVTPITLPTIAPDGGTINPYPAGLAVSADGRTGYVVDQLADALTTLDLKAGRVLATVGVGHNPLAVALSADGATAYVSNQGASTISAVDVTNAASPHVARTIDVGTHPTAMLLRDQTLYVANSDADSVSEVDTASGTVARTIDLAPYRGAPVGSNPDGLALSTDGRTLYVAEAGANSVDVVDLGGPLARGASAAHRQDGGKRRARVVGMIPTGWYPSSVVLSRTGDRLLVTNAKGLGAGPNDGPGYPNPTRPGPAAPDQYSGSMITGTLSSIAVPDRPTLVGYTRQVQRNDGFTDGAAVRGDAAPGNPVPQRVGDPSPIKHVIYVVKENRTYDQELGSLDRGNGDPSLNLFGDESAPNARRLAKQFVTLDNFYADAEVSADGWNWSTAANANRYVQGTWVATYSGRNHPYDYEGGNLATAPNRDPQDAYIWDRLDKAGKSFRNYGFFTFGKDNTTAATEPNLVANTDHAYHGYDLSCPDHPDSFAPRSTACGTPRYAEWKREFDGYVDRGDLPTMQFVRLPSDHTSGTRAGYPTPQAYVADNDWALGDLVNTVSHSRYWASTAIFVLEDDAQNGPDHVDAHRTVAQVISPYTRRGSVDSTLYSTTSMLRTMELIAGVGPLTQFDAFATPMASVFQSQPDLGGYDAVKPTYDMTTANGSDAPMAAASAAQNLTTADRINERTFNEAIWKSVRGAGSVMPAPRHAVPTRAGDGDG